MNRQHRARRQMALWPAPIQPVTPMVQHAGGIISSGSALTQPTPPAHQGSPSTSCFPGFAMQGGMISPTSDVQAQQMQHQRSSLPLQRSKRISLHHASPRVSTPAITSAQQPHSPLISTCFQAPASAQSNYCSTTFQKHYHQLGKLSRSCLPFIIRRALFVLG